MSVWAKAFPPTINYLYRAVVIGAGLRTYHLSNNERMRHMLSYGRGYTIFKVNYLTKSILSVICN